MSALASAFLSRPRRNSADLTGQRARVTPNCLPVGEGVGGKVSFWGFVEGFVGFGKWPLRLPSSLFLIMEWFFREVESTHLARSFQYSRHISSLEPPLCD